ncbi:MerR family transcriptional regulator [Cryobacterium lactosi]|uniref:MerR family transcriptional regulator n=1 Tax=Cryobacterium lactosi TaxID=1259202 RepID=A0A4R9BX72_9MICO|nr:MerR family transcriptional regulator [Cryobacterium lactosi]TFD92113.1 MerR family transcriptional regulator [Cryobacterium lactosi]
MAWSTSELANLAGTTVKAVRHYHALGLLAQPERRTNGYKQYEVHHVVRLLQIRRLVDLGLPLTQIASMQGADDNPREAFRAIDAELAVTIERLQRMRTELAAIAEHGAPVDLPPGFSEAAPQLNSIDRSLVMIYSRIFDDNAMGDMRQIMEVKRTDADDEFEALPVDADLATKIRLAKVFALELAGLREKYPWLEDPGSVAAGSVAQTEDTVTQTVTGLYNLAQLEVIYRAHLNATGETDDRLPTLEENP